MSARSVAGLVLALLCSRAAADASVPVVNSGHRLAVTALGLDAGTGLLFSASEDGLAIAWDVAGRRPVSRLQVSRLPIRMLAVHPRLPQLAVVESDLAVTRLSVWDYSEARRLFVLELDMLPSSLAYSSTGRYLVASRERYDGLLFLDPQTGERLPMFVGGFGIVSFVTFNSDDAVMMSYQPSGEVRYWDMATQTQRFRAIMTEPFLRLVALSGSEDSPKDSLVGSSGRYLVVADVVRAGTVKERVELPDLLAISSSGRGDVACLSRVEGGVLLTRWRYRPGVGLLRLSEELIGGEDRIGGLPTVLTAGATEMYVGTDDGTIVSRPPYGPTQLFSRNEMAAVSDIALRGRLLLVAIEGAVLEFDVGAAEQAAGGGSREGVASAMGQGGLVGIGPPGEGRSGAPASVTMERRPAPMEGVLRLSTSGRGDVWAWSPGADRGEIVQYLPGSPDPRGSRLAFLSPLKSVAWVGSELCVVERSGRCSILRESPFEPSGFSTVFEYPCPGANAMVGTPRAAVIGKSALSRWDSALLLVDRRTGETAPLAAQGGLVYELAYVPETDSILSISVTRDTEPWTSLRRSFGAQYLQSRLVAEFHGEDTGAEVARREAEGTIYASLGFEVGHTMADGTWALQRSALRAPRRIALGTKALFSLNGDGTITAWDAASLEVIADLYVFRDGEWLAISAGGVSAASPGGARHLSEVARGPER